MRYLGLLTLVAVTFFSDAARARSEQRLVAVLPLSVREKALNDAARETIEEGLRTTAGDFLTPAGYTVLTGDNTLKLLNDNGVDANKACEASCALEAARELKAELFLSGSIAKLEGEYVLFVRLFEQASGKQVSSVQLEAKTLKELRASFREQASRFFAPVLKAVTPAAQLVPEAAPAKPVDGSKLWEALNGRFEFSAADDTITLYSDGQQGSFSQGQLEYRRDVRPPYEVSYSVRRLSNDADRPQEFAFLGGSFAISVAGTGYYFYETDQHWTGWKQTTVLRPGWNDVRVRQNGQDVEAWVNGERVGAFKMNVKPSSTRVSLFIKGAPGQAAKVQFRNFRLNEL